MAFKLAEAFVELSSRGLHGVQAAVSSAARGFQAMAQGAAASSQAMNSATSGAVRGFQAMTRAASNTSRGVMRGFSAMGGAIRSVMSYATRLQTILGGLGASISVLGLIKLAADAEQLAVMFEVFTGSAAKASAILKEITQLAALTPFSKIGLADAGKILMQYGVAADNVVGTINTLSEVAAGNEEKLRLIALAFGQITANGRLMGQDLLQLINAGFNPLQEISKRTGKSMTDLRADMEAGRITLAMVQQAFIDATSEGGRFYKMNEKQSRTLSGLWSTLVDELREVGIGIGQDIVEVFNLKGVTSNLIGFAQTFRERFAAPIRSTLEFIRDIMLRAVSGFNRMRQMIEGNQAAIDTAQRGLSIMWDRMKAVWELGAAVFSALSDLIVYLSGENVLGGAIRKVGEFGLAFFETITLLISETAFWVKNWDLAWKLAVESVRIQVENLGKIFLNLGQNIESLWTAMLDFINGRGFNPDFTGITDGLKSTTEEMDKILMEAAKRRQQGFKPNTVAAAMAAAQTGASSPFRGIEVTGGTSGSGKKADFVSFADLAANAQKDSFNEAKATRQAVEKTAASLDVISEAVESGAVKVKVQNLGLGAVYA